MNVKKYIHHYTAALKSVLMLLLYGGLKIANTKMATPNTDYNKYTNDELKQMIDELVKNNLITSQLEAKFTDAIFKRHHDKPFNDDDTRKSAQRRNALQYYYRKKLIRLYDKI